MKKALVSVLLVLMFCVLPGRIEPGEAKSRSVVLKETLRLEDGQADLFFKSPRRILEIPGQWIYLLDDQRALRFSGEGKGFGEVVPRGEGPGELTRVHYVARLDEQVLLLSAYPFKVLLAGLDGSFQREFRPTDQGNFYNLEETWQGRMLLSRRRRDFLSSAKQGVSDLPVELSWMDLKGRIEPLPLKGIIEKIYLQRLNLEGGRVAIAVNEACSLKTCLDGMRKRLFISYTPRYAVDMIDVETGKRLAVLKRPFQPIDYYAPPQDKDEEEEPSRFKPYEPEQFNDILALHHVLGELWVISSDFTTERGFRVDRFNVDGAFAGSVYLNVPGLNHPDDLDQRILEFVDNRLWVNQPDEDGNPVPVRYTVSLSN